MRALMILTAATMLTACASSGSGQASGTQASQTQTSTKNIFSTWQSAQGIVLELSGLQFSTPKQINYSYAGQFTCQVTITINGDNSGGNYSFANATTQAGGNAPAACAQLDGLTGIYTNNGQTLIVCPSTAPMDCTSFN